MIGVEVKTFGKEDHIRKYCKNIHVYDLSNADFTRCNKWYLIECMSGEAHLAKQKSKATVSNTLKPVDICNIDILSKVDINHPYHDLYVLLVGTV